MFFFYKGSIACILFTTAHIVGTYSDVPDAGAVEEKGANFSHLLDIAHIPHIETVVIVNHTQLQTKKNKQSNNEVVLCCSHIIS